MYFHIEEKRAWIKSQGHIYIPERHPDYARFASDKRGVIQRMLRIWLVEPRDNKPYLRAYLGVISCRIIGPSFREWHRLFRLTSKEARTAGIPAKDLRRKLEDLLRNYLEKELTLNQNHQIQ